MLASAPMGRRAVTVFLIGVVGWLAIPAVCASATGYDATIAALDNVFAEQIVRIQPGQTVEWTNEGHTPHTVTADDGSWDSGDLQAGASYSRTFDTPGIYTLLLPVPRKPGGRDDRHGCGRRRAASRGHRIGHARD